MCLKTTQNIIDTTLQLGLGTMLWKIPNCYLLDILILSRFPLDYVKLILFPSLWWENNPLQRFYIKLHWPNQLWIHSRSVKLSQIQFLPSLSWRFLNKPSHICSTKTFRRKIMFNFGFFFIFLFFFQVFVLSGRRKRRMKGRERLREKVICNPNLPQISCYAVKEDAKFPILLLQPLRWTDYKQAPPARIH